MLSSTRRESILAELRDAGEVSVTLLAQRLGVSPSTVRRDLNTLSREGHLNRVRGGGAAESGTTTPGGPRPRQAEPDARPFGVVATDRVDAKDRIGARAARLVPEHGVVVLDIGTTAARVAHHLRGRHVTVVTANLAVVDVLRDDPAVELVVLGGVLRRSYLSLVGGLTEQALSHISADVSVLGTSGVRADGSPLDSTSTEVPVKQAILRSAARRVLVADAGKFPGSGLLAYTDPQDVDVLVTTPDADSSGLHALRRRGTEVLLA
ncbi:DeoR/GlpR family DNA-binding transcription regulator [Georgenia sp. 10Sc9-8]|uniref:Lactose phosphotransferase system repressor n=1 Tax=Georgenia halotolerans TaxID=3028317 RepID=A0ABT5TZS4_9MICO|nr:DeoR/GlpR family DNA-binding transcription regulator [Georgenia halotolerans]